MRCFLLVILIFLTNKVFSQQFSRDSIFFNLSFSKGIDSVLLSLNQNTRLSFIRDSVNTHRRSFPSTSYFYKINTREGFFSNDFIPDSVVLELQYVVPQKRKSSPFYLLVISMDFNKTGESEAEGFRLSREKLLSFLTMRYARRREEHLSNSAIDLYKYIWVYSNTNKKDRPVKRDWLLVSSSRNISQNSERQLLEIMISVKEATRGK